MSDHPASENVLELRGVGRRLPSGGKILEILSSADLTVKKGEIVALVGPSGSGKSTLLHVAGLLDRPQEGEITL